MSGDPAYASLWTTADVYVGPTTAANPATVSTAFGADWNLVGLLSGDDGFALSRSQDTTDFFAWGSVLVRKSRKNFTQTVKFTALEYNDTTRDLMWPDSPAGSIVVPQPKRIKIAFELTEGTTVRRLISAYQAEVDLDGDEELSESKLSTYPFVATIFPDASGNLFVEQQTAIAS